MDRTKKVAVVTSQCPAVANASPHSIPNGHCPDAEPSGSSMADLSGVAPRNLVGRCPPPRHREFRGLRRHEGLERRKTEQVVSPLAVGVRAQVRLAALRVHGSDLHLIRASADYDLVLLAVGEAHHRRLVVVPG